MAYVSSLGWKFEGKSLNLADTFRELSELKDYTFSSYFKDAEKRIRKSRESSFEDYISDAGYINYIAHRKISRISRKSNVSFRFVIYCEDLEYSVTNTDPEDGKADVWNMEGGKNGYIDKAEGQYLENVLDMAEMYGYIKRTDNMKDSIGIVVNYNDLMQDRGRIKGYKKCGDVEYLHIYRTAFVNE